MAKDKDEKTPKETSTDVRKLAAKGLGKRGFDNAKIRNLNSAPVQRPNKGNKRGR